MKIVKNENLLKIYDSLKPYFDKGFPDGTPLEVISFNLNVFAKKFYVVDISLNNKPFQEYMNKSGYFFWSVEGLSKIYNELLNKKTTSLLNNLKNEICKIDRKSIDFFPYIISIWSKLKSDEFSDFCYNVVLDDCKENGKMTGLNFFSISVKRDSSVILEIY